MTVAKAPLREGARSDIGRIVEFCLSVPKLRLLGIAALMIGAIALADWEIGLAVSLGALYILPMMLAAVWLRPRGVVALAALCAVLRFLFDQPGAPVETSLRFCFALFAYLISGLFVGALIRNRRLTLEHLDEQKRRIEVEEQLKVLVESSPAGIFVVDDLGKVVAANDAANQIFGFDQDQRLEGAFIQDHLPLLADALRCSAEPFRTGAQCQGRRRTGEIFLADTWFSTYRASNGQRLAAIVVDSSEEMRSREEQNLRQLSAGTRIMAAAVLHEVRNFCSAISLVYSNLRREANAGDENFQRLGDLVAGLGQIASRDLKGRSEEALVEASLQQVLDNLRIIIEPGWLDIGGAIRFDLPPRLPKVIGEAHGLLQAFLNLAQNSHRAVQACEVKELRIGVSIEDQRVMVRFADSGPGVLCPELVFQPFQPGAQGAGLGLYISRALIRSYGGELRLEAQGKGACFEVELHALAEGAQ
jgi:PAS domain S-box-containing protein